MESYRTAILRLYSYVRDYHSSTRVACPNERYPGNMVDFYFIVSLYVSDLLNVTIVQSGSAGQTVMLSPYSVLVLVAHTRSRT